jgi:TPP-dependent trihydroxycyclohexane-1,2-dione (THcHDO) dehydratase
MPYYNAWSEHLNPGMAVCAQGSMPSPVRHLWQTAQEPLPSSTP